jgi:hypothetical protein
VFEVDRTARTRWARLIEVAAAFLTVALLMASRRATADDIVQFAPPDVRSVFFIAKSQNRNQVHYGIRLDRECNPIGTRPVFAYWRMFENQGEGASNARPKRARRLRERTRGSIRCT